MIIRDYNFKIKMVSKEYQHTCKSTGLMLWESARLMASVLAANKTIVEGKKVLELGCGCGGMCSMVAAESAELVVATDGDPKAIDLLKQNVASNLRSPLHTKNMLPEKLEWGNQMDIANIKKLNNAGFDIIIGTDVTYVSEAISPLFATARELIAVQQTNGREPAFILCHVFRRVDEPSILSAASQFGFKLIDRWPAADQISSIPFQSIINGWFSKDQLDHCSFSTALNIMYFTV